MTALPAKLIGVLLALLVVVGVGFGVRAHIRADAVLDFKLAAERQRGDSIQKAVDFLASVEREKDGLREQALQKANASVAQGKVLAAQADSQVRASANERQKAEAARADSGATSARLREALGSLVEQSRADSGSFARTLAAERATNHALMDAIRADSVSLSAHEAREKALESLQVTLRGQISLLKAQRPSVVGQALKGALVLAGGILIGQHIH